MATSELYPFIWFQYFLTRINRIDRQPFMFYVHPWEVDPAQPRMPVRSRVARCRHYVNRQSIDRKLEALLKQLCFGRVGDLVKERLA